MAQVLSAKVALAVLIIFVPIVIPWLIFKPTAFLFWGWLKTS